MGLTAALGSALGRPVLDHGRHGTGAPALVLAVHDRGLQAVAERAAHIAGECRVLAERAGVALPARVGGDVGLRAEERGDAHLAELAAHAGTGLLGDLGIEGCGEAEVAGPVGAVGAVARVGCEVDGHLVGAGLDVGLQAVRELGLLERGIAGERVQDGADVVVKERLLVVGELLALDGALVRGEAHEAGDLLDGEAARQVRGALVSGEAPVGVRHELAGALEVLEVLAVDLDEAEAALGRVGEAGAAVLLDDHVAEAGVDADAGGLGLGLGSGLVATLRCRVVACREGSSGRSGGGGEEVPA